MSEKQVGRAFAGWLSLTGGSATNGNGGALANLTGYGISILILLMKLHNGWHWVAHVRHPEAPIYKKCDVIQDV